MSGQSYTTRDVSGDIIGAGASGIAAKEIHGNVIQVIIRSEDLARDLGKLEAMPTEVKQSHAAGLEGNPAQENTNGLQESINELLEVIRSSNRKGRKVNEIHAGNFHISQVELLLKKAVLIKSDAEQMYLDQVSKNELTDEAPVLSAHGMARLDLGVIMEGFDESAYLAKLREAYELLEEASGIDPCNTEVLLHMAQLLIELTPDDPSDEQRILYRIQNLLENPHNESELFRLAQATFLLATSGEQIHESLLGDAQAMFKKIGRTEWIRQCDDLLKTLKSVAITSTGEMVFDPVGQWDVRVSDFVGSTMQLSLQRNGNFEALQQTGIYGVEVNAAGQWAYIPSMRMLQIQGFLGGGQPFFLGIMIQFQQGEIFYGMGTDSFSYTLQRPERFDV